MGQKCASLSDEVACVTRSQYFLQSESGLHFVGFFFGRFFFFGFYWVASMANPVGICV